MSSNGASFPITLEPRNNTGAARHGFKDFRFDSFALQHAFDIVRDLRLIAGRILSVNSYKIDKKMYRLGLGLRRIQRKAFGLCQAQACGRKHTASHEHR